MGTVRQHPVMVTEVNVTICPFLPAISKIVQDLIDIQELSTMYREELGNSTTKGKDRQRGLAQVVYYHKPSNCNSMS